MPQQTLGRHHDQRLRHSSKRPAAARDGTAAPACGLSDLNVVVRGETQKTSPGERWNARALPFVTVRQQQHHAAEAVPLVLGAGDELVDDHLRGVEKSPNCASQITKAFRAIEAVAVVETEHAGFRQRTVVDLDAAACPPQMFLSGLKVWPSS